MSQGIEQTGVYHDADGLLRQFFDDEDRDGRRNFEFRVTQLPDAATNQRILYWNLNVTQSHAKIVSFWSLFLIFVI
jgi:hypothetical protein